MTTTDTRAKTIKRRVTASKKASAVRKKMDAQRRRIAATNINHSELDELLEIAEADMQGLIDWDRGLEDFYKYRK